MWLINANDATLGVLVLAVFAALSHARRRPPGERRGWEVGFVLVVLFRDATLFRETVEYMWDHHRSGYALTSMARPELRPHYVAALWTVNGCWLLAPLLTFYWAFLHFTGGGVENKPK